MPVNASRNRFPIDAELILRAAGQAAVTSDTPTNAYVLPRDDSYWGYGLIPDFELAVVLDVDALDLANADETYVFIIQVDTAANFPSPTEVGRITVTAAGVQSVVINKERLLAAEAGAATHLRGLMDVGGTTPSITFSAYLSPVVGG